MKNLVRKNIMLQVTSADCEGLLNTLIQLQIPLKEVTRISDLMLRLTINRRYYEQVCKIANKQGASATIVQKAGLLWQTDTIVKRPLLLGIFTLLFLACCYLPSRVFFISVDGNVSVPDNQILEAAEKCGLVFGVSGRNIRNEEIKNALLEALPELKWIGVNTRGCTAVISVKEKSQVEESIEIKNEVCSIVAARDGIIQSCTVYNGNPLCSVGQAVSAGQTLVSGYSDYGLVTKATRASAEIKALTVRDLELVSPSATDSRGDVDRKSFRYSLKIGKKVIKFYKDSGNLDATCAKIYTEEYAQLPGGFKLPVSLIKEMQILYHEGTGAETSAELSDWLESYAREYILSTMVAGQIISEQVDKGTHPETCQLSGKYACIEMIGVTRHEQTITKDVDNE